MATRLVLVGFAALALSSCPVNAAETAPAPKPASPAPPAHLGEPAGAPSAPGELLLMGFEKADVQRIDALCKGRGAGSKTEDGAAVVTLAPPGGQVWCIFKGSASQGECALGLGKAALPGDAPFEFAGVEMKNVPPEAALHCGIYHSQYSRGLNTCGLFRALFPKDWSGHDLFRVDAFAHDVAQVVRISIEDEEIAPPVVRDFKIEPGKWVTLEVDIRAAAKERGLDLKRMAVLGRMGDVLDNHLQWKM